MAESRPLTADELYRLDICDLRVDLRAQLFREIEAMAVYMGSRGIAPPGLVQNNLGMLDVGILRRAEIPMSEFLALHAALSEAIRPALPRAIEMLHWDAQTSRWNWLAPVGAIRKLMLAALLFFTVFVLTTMTGFVTAKHVASPLFGLEGRWTILSMMAFYLSLAGLGACFSVLYDARKYVIEGTYDPRIGSNYAIRIALGLMAGLILAQLLSDPEFAKVGSGVAGAPTADAAAADGTQAAGARTEGVGSLQLFGKPLLALLGGFAAQFVYTALARFVSALENVFQPERSVEIALRERELRVAADEKTAKARLEQAAAATRIAARLETTDDPAAKRGLVEELLGVVAGGPAASAALGEVARAAAPVAERIARVEQALRIGRALAAVLPDDEAKRAIGALDGVADKLARARAVVEKGASGDVVGAAADAARELMAVDPVRELVMGAVSRLGGPLASLGLGATPAGLALAVVTVAARLGEREFAKWKARILDAPYTPDLLPASTMDAASVGLAFAAAPAFAAGFSAQMTDMAALNDLGRRVASEDADALFARYGDRFGGDRAGFDAALGAFRAAILGARLTVDLPAEAVAAAGVKDGAALMQALDAARADPAAREALERLTLLGATARPGDGDVAPRLDPRSLLTHVEAIAREKLP